MTSNQILYAYMDSPLGKILLAKNSIGLIHISFQEDQNRKSPEEIIPCHRVIGSNGRLTGYTGGIHIKKALLELEQHIPTQLGLFDYQEHNGSLLGA